MNCKVMGIVNVTPDSFSDGGQFFKPEEAIRRVRNLIAEGADVIDLGAESTRPGAHPIAWEEEWARLEPVLGGLGGGRETRDGRREESTRLGSVPRKSDGQFPASRAVLNQTTRLGSVPRKSDGLFPASRAVLSQTIFSIDTYHPETAERALQMGARMINCVKIEPVSQMLQICSKYGAELIIPSSALGSVPSLFVPNPLDAFCEGLEARGARRDDEIEDYATSNHRGSNLQPSTFNLQPFLWIDPMIGFGTSRAEDLALLRSVPELAKRGRVLVGVSRKRIVRRLSGEHGVGKLLGGSVALALWCATHGASMVRVHDVRETVEALAAWSALED